MSPGREFSPQQLSWTLLNFSAFLSCRCRSAGNPRQGSQSPQSELEKSEILERSAQGGTHYLSSNAEPGMQSQPQGSVGTRGPAALGASKEAQPP